MIDKYALLVLTKGLHSAVHRMLDDEDLDNGAGDQQPTDDPEDIPDEGNKGDDGLEPYEKFGYIVLAVVLLVFLCLLWQCCSWCRKRRERQALAMESARADSVLGDMAMIPREDTDDDDGELI